MAPSMGTVSVRISSSRNPARVALYRCAVSSERALVHAWTFFVVSCAAVRDAARMVVAAAFSGAWLGTRFAISVITTAMGVTATASMRGALTASF